MAAPQEELAKFFLNQGHYRYNGELRSKLKNSEEMATTVRTYRANERDTLQLIKQFKYAMKGEVSKHVATLMLSYYNGYTCEGWTMRVVGSNKNN